MVRLRSGDRRLSTRRWARGQIESEWATAESAMILENRQSDSNHKSTPSVLVTRTHNNTPHTLTYSPLYHRHFSCIINCFLAENDNRMYRSCAHPLPLIMVRLLQENKMKTVITGSTCMNSFSDIVRSGNMCCICYILSFIMQISHFYFFLPKNITKPIIPLVNSVKLFFDIFK